MKIEKGFVEGNISSPDTGKVKSYKLEINNISTDEEDPGGDINGIVYSPDTGRTRRDWVRHYYWRLCVL